MFKATKDRFKNVEAGLLRLAGHQDNLKARLTLLEESRQTTKLLELSSKLASALEKMDVRIANLETQVRSLERTQCETYGIAMERVRAMLTHEEKIKAAKDAQTIINLR